MLGVGVDVVEVSRISRILDRHPRFAEKAFTEEERAWCDARRESRAACYAARWAAKEACVKSLGGVPGGRWREIHVLRADDGSVRIDLSGTARVRAEELGVARILVSFSHERSVAVAMCTALGGGSGP
ncbi:MAG: holo-ACP synthase [Actinobacteria bacterium]|nr:holo-ACP synthase [Actinomycetota bacterium]